MYVWHSLRSGRALRKSFDSVADVSREVRSGSSAPPPIRALYGTATRIRSVSISGQDTRHPPILRLCYEPEPSSTRCCSGARPRAFASRPCSWRGIGRIARTWNYEMSTYFAAEGIGRNTKPQQGGRALLISQRPFRIKIRAEVL
jgi:hypothetical protein